MRTWRQGTDRPGKQAGTLLPAFSARFRRIFLFKILQKIDKETGHTQLGKLRDASAVRVLRAFLAKDMGRWLPLVVPERGNWPIVQA